MKKMISLAVMLACAFSSLAYADGPNDNPGQQQEWQKGSGHGGRESSPQRSADNRGPQGNQGNQGNSDYRGPQRNNRGGQGDHDMSRPNRHEQDHFALNGHDFRKGQPAPERYRGNDYRVNDWNDRGLPAPPQGQHWSYIDGNYVLIAAATGIITSILVNGILHH